MICVMNENYAPLYHTTTQIVPIYKSNTLKATSDDNDYGKPLLYFTRSKKVASDFNSMYPDEFPGAIMTFDKNKLTSKYKIYPFANNLGKLETSEVCDKDINNVFDYVTELDILRIEGFKYNSDSYLNVFSKIPDKSEIKEYIGTSKCYDSMDLIFDTDNLTNDEYGLIAQVLTLINICLDKSVNMGNIISTIYNYIK